jgi:FkbM family methyltransferase
LTEPFLRIKIGKESLGHRIRQLVLALISEKDIVIRTNFGAELLIPKGYKGVYEYIEGYEPEVTALISRLLKPGMTMVDVGAHLGYYTLLAKFNNVNVFAFEPDPYYFSLLLKNLERNRIIKGVYAYQMAVADKLAMATFFADNSGGRGNLYAPVGERIITVPTITLDAFFEKLGWPQVDLIKIDVEGAEVAVLNGMRELSKQNKSLRLIIEFALNRPSGVQADEFFNALEKLGFTRLFAIEKPSLEKPEEIIREAARVGYLNLFCEKVS